MCTIKAIPLIFICHKGIQLPLFTVNSRHLDIIFVDVCMYVCVWMWQHWVWYFASISFHCLHFSTSLTVYFSIKNLYSCCRFSLVSNFRNCSIYVWMEIRVGILMLMCRSWKLRCYQLKWWTEVKVQLSWVVWGVLGLKIFWWFESEFFLLF